MSLYLTEAELAERWRLPLSRIRAWQRKGRGPRPWLRLGREIRYPIASVEKFEAEHLYGTHQAEREVALQVSDQRPHVPANHRLRGHRVKPGNRGAHRGQGDAGSDRGGGGNPPDQGARLQ